MKAYRFPVNIFCLVTLTISVHNVEAEQQILFYKTGDVGAFSATIEMPANIDVNTTVFTARASNEKIYLLYVQSPQWLAERLTNTRYSSYRPDLNPEQRAKQAELGRQAKELNKKRGEVWTRLRKARESLKGLEALRKEISKDTPQDKDFLDKTEAKIKQVEAVIIDAEAMSKTVAEQISAIRGQEREILAEAQRLSEKTLKPKAGSSLEIFGRFQGRGKVKLSVFGRDSGELSAEPWLIASVELELPSADGGNAELLRQWATAQAKEYTVRIMDSPHSSYYQYCVVQSEEKYGLSESVFRGMLRDRTGRRGRAPDLYAMTTGALAIQESLQLEEMTGRREIPSGRDVAISTLEGPSIKSHPFSEMLEGRKPKLFGVAALVPHDNYYCHFSSISKEIAASDLFKQWGASLLRAATVTARDSDLPGRYMNQLCIDLSVLTRLFGDFIIGEIAITGGDPFMREGSDVALIIQVKNRRVCDAMMTDYANGVAKANRDAKAYESKYGGISIRSIVTPDRRISSHSAYLGDYKVYSNSMDTLQLIIDTHAKRRKSMAENLDLKYMRTIFPGAAAAEDGFIYLSDSFIRKLLSARWKIEAQRRIICQNHLRMISNAETMYRMEMRRKPSIETLVEEKYLSEKTTRCPDGGTYSLDESGRAFCTVHNCLQYCTPISSIALEKAAEVEANDYRQFVMRYSRYWSRFFDPIGIRLRIGDRIEAETCILPLIENSIYNQLREIIGGEPVELDSKVLTEGTIVSIASKLGIASRKLDEVQREILDEISPTLPGISECFGESVSLNFYDSDVLFTFAQEGMGMFGGWMDLEEQIIFGLIASSINLPVYTVVELKDEDLTRTLIREMVRVIQRQSVVQGRGEFGVEPYSAGQYKAHEINTLTLNLFVVKFRLHYAIVSGRLIVSTKRYVLEKVLDSLDRKQPDAEGGDIANLQVDIHPRAFDRLRPVMRLGWQERMRDACLKNLEPVRVLVECHGATEQTLNATSRQVEGVTLRCPSGGAYKHDRERDIVYCTVHGNCNHARQPRQAIDSEGLLKFLGRITDFSVQFRFTEEGIMTKVALELESGKK